jgi:membrane protein
MRVLRDLLTTPAAELGRAGRFLLFQYRLWSHCFTLLRKNRAEQLAAALSYYTIFGIIPLAIVVVLIFHSIPDYRQTGEQLKNIVYNELRLTQIEYPDSKNPEERVVLTDYLDETISQFFTNLDKAPLGVVSAILVIWAALRLLTIIETAFNHMGHVPRGRRFVHRVINYWALLTLVPLLLGAGLYVTTRYTIIERFETGLLAAVSPLISYLVSVLALFLLYLVMPNAKVQARAAVIGAAAAALVWTFAKWGFGAYVTQLIPYRTIYGVLGLIPLTVFWIYVSWLIVLFGLQLTFAIQHFKVLETAETPKGKEAEERFIANDMTAITMAREIALAFESGSGPISTDDICTCLDIPGEFCEKFLEELVHRGVLAKTTDPKRGFTLAKGPERIKLSEIADVVTAFSFAQPQPNTHGSLSDIAREQRALLASHDLKETLGPSATPALSSPQRQENLPPEDESPQTPASDMPMA